MKGDITSRKGLQARVDLLEERLVEVWHAGHTGTESLAHALGFTEAEYADWVRLRQERTDAVMRRRPLRELREHPGRHWRFSCEGPPHPKLPIEMESEGEFDELVVSDWLHIERMDERVWWMRVGDRAFDIEIPLEGPVVVQEREEGD